MSKVYGYARVSTDNKQEQSLEHQEDRLEEAGANRVYKDRASGRIKWSKREGLNKAVSRLTEGDTLMVTALDRLGRSVHDITGLVQRLNDEGIHLKVLDFPGEDGPVSTKGAVGKAMVNLLLMFAEFEVDIRADRAKAGHAARKARGESPNGGRKPKLTPAQVREARELLERGASVSSLAAQFGVSRTTIYKNVPRD